MEKTRYKVLLVDDELIILSGLKFLIDWEGIDCHIIGTANNGGEALKMIEEQSPDIVVCDINMPVYNGVEVLKRSNKIAPNTVFIMLTNHQDFHLVQQSLKYRAVDYIVKTNLQPKLLVKSIENAQNECNKRRKINKIDFVENYIHKNETEILKDSLLSVLSNPSDDYSNLDDALRLCSDAGLFQHYFIMQVYINTPDIQNINLFTAEEKSKLVQCEIDIINKICKNFFDDYIILEWNSSSVLLFIYQAEEIDKEYIRNLYKKIASASKTILETSIDLTVTDVFNTIQSISSCIDQFKKINNYYYYNNTDIVFYDEHDEASYPDSFDISNIINMLNKGLMTYSTTTIDQAFKQLIDQLVLAKPKKRNAINCCVRLYNYSLATLQSLDHPKTFNENFSNSAETINKINALCTFDDVILWLKDLNNTINHYYSLINTSSNNLIDSAKEYIMTNIQTKLTLKSVADYLSITPSYLSCLFKKECNRNFIDYVNRLKIDKACELLTEKKYLIYEIAYMLGFDNAYYFTKIFRKYKGVTPKEYMQLK